MLISPSTRIGSQVYLSISGPGLIGWYVGRSAANLDG